MYNHYNVAQFSNVIGQKVLINFHILKTAAVTVVPDDFFLLSFSFIIVSLLSDFAFTQKPTCLSLLLLSC